MKPRFGKRRYRDGERIYYDSEGNRVLSKENLAAAMTNIRRMNHWLSMIETRKEWIGDDDWNSKDVILSEQYVHLDRAITRLVSLGALRRI